MAHHCHAVPCKVQVPEKLLMCSPHWRKVPRDIQARVWATYRDGQEREKNPSLAWCQAADAAVASVATREGRPAPRATFVRAFFPFGEEVKCGTFQDIPEVPCYCKKASGYRVHGRTNCWRSIEEWKMAGKPALGDPKSGEGREV